MTNLPSLDEARSMICDTKLSWSQLCDVAGVITASPSATYEDLLACLRVRGLPAEWAACRLYVSTRRPRKDSSIESVSLDYEDWENYLRDKIHVNVLDRAANWPEKKQSWLKRLVGESYELPS